MSKATQRPEKRKKKIDKEKEDSSDSDSLTDLESIQSQTNSTSSTDNIEIHLNHKRTGKTNHTTSRRTKHTPSDTNTTNNALENENKILSIIHEKAANIEQITHKNDIAKTIENTIARMARTERDNNLSTITITKDENKLNYEQIIKEVEDLWIDKFEGAPTTHWQDKMNTYIQFINPIAKNTFIEILKKEKDNPLKNNIPNIDSKSQYTKKPIRLEITGVKGNIVAKKIEETIRKNVSKEAKISDFREGKTSFHTKTKIISFLANGEALNDLMKEMKWTIPYYNKTTGTRARFNLKINCKPWLCRDCFAIGRHECQGRKCAKCGNKDHPTKECTSPTKFCTNCHKKGHKARDIHCPTYLHNLTKNLMKTDIPAHLLENNKTRAEIIDKLQLK